MPKPVVRARIAGLTFAGVAVLGLAGCAQPVSGTSTPASTVEPAAPSTVLVPSTVYVEPPPATVTAPPKQRTPCQQMYVDGYSYDDAVTAWADAGFPPNWDADHDGYPCEQTFGDMN